MKSGERDNLRTFLLRSVSYGGQVLVGKPRSMWLRIVRFVPALAIMVAIFVYSASSNPPGATLPRRVLGLTGGSNDSVHAIVYSFLAAALVWGTWPLFRKARWAFLSAWVIASCYGGLDELHQTFVPRRACSFEDWIADSVGALVGCAVLAGVYLILRRVRRRTSSTTPNAP